MIIWAPCSNGATRHHARGGNLVGAGKRIPRPDIEMVATDSDEGRVLLAEDMSTVLTAAGGGFDLVIDPPLNSSRQYAK